MIFYLQDRTLSCFALVWTVFRLPVPTRVRQTGKRFVCRLLLNLLFSLQTGITPQAVSFRHHHSVLLLWKQRWKVSRSVLLRLTILDKGVWQEVNTFTFKLVVVCLQTALDRRPSCRLLKCMRNVDVMWCGIQYLKEFRDFLGLIDHARTFKLCDFSL